MTDACAVVIAWAFTTGDSFGADAILDAKPVGVPPAHWSNSFTFGIRFSEPVHELPPQALKTIGAKVIATHPANGRQTLWKVRVQPGWSSDAQIQIESAEGPCADTGVLCSAAGNRITRPIEVRIGARP